MSLQSLNLNYPKKWLNARVNNIQVDNKLILPKNVTPTVQLGSVTANVTVTSEHGLLVCHMFKLLILYPLLLVVYVLFMSEIWALIL
jgi:hypothetical protein